MIPCPSCSRDIPETSRFCLACGASVVAPENADTLLGAPGAPTAAASRPVSGSASDHGRFTPGEIVAQRYRIIALRGRGGMGEVYRADDLKLGQPVALKFLPADFERDPARLERFLGEVRTARQVSHPNVCRTHDIGEIGGSHFLSMEYVDGEDLASLLPRIGRFPAEKATEIARQICAGLAAAHGKGILHRDLKPANVMLDTQGKVRITDFGLAGLAAEIPGSEIRSGTPAYMAPEQLAGKEVTIRSDIYALGLVLYELFTGRPAFKARSVAELQRLQSETAPASITSLVAECDPAVERVILRCLEHDPSRRPVSALAVAAALPGGNPLAAALEAGETPSPEMVAAAGEAGGLTPLAAWGCLALFFLSLAGAGLIASRERLIHRVPLGNPPEVLRQKARDALADLGYHDPAAGSRYWFGADGAYLDYLAQHDRSARRWDSLGSGQPAALCFLYRQSPRPLEPLSGNGLVSMSDPPMTVPGMVNLQLDTRGRLVFFAAVPPEVDDGVAPPPEPDWKRLFVLAGLDAATFQEARSAWNPSVFADARKSWKGAFPDAPSIPIHVEAAAYRGRPVYFNIVTPWDRPRLMDAEAIRPGLRIGSILNVVFLTIAIVTAIVLARRNMRLGRGDRRGAFRFALFLLLVSLSDWLVSANHLTNLPKEWNIFLTALGEAAVPASIAWILYIALEPLIRRHWPESIISWSRLLAGRFNDPLVGRDVLFGAAAGTGISLLSWIGARTPLWLGLPPTKPPLGGIDVLLGFPQIVGHYMDISGVATIQAIVFLFFMAIGYVSSRKNLKQSILIFFTICTIMQYLFGGGGYVAIDLTLAALKTAILTGILVRFGLLANLATVFFSIWDIPLPPDLSAWYAGRNLFGAAVLVLIALHGFYRSLAGRPLLASRLSGE